MDNDKKYLFDNPKNIQRVLYFLYGSCVILFILDFVIHRHVLHSWESLWGFYPLYGFIGCVVLVLVATWLRTFLMRSEKYYSENDGSEDKTDTKKTAANKNSTASGGHNVDA